MAAPHIENNGGAALPAVLVSVACELLLFALYPPGELRNPVHDSRSRSQPFITRYSSVPAHRPPNLLVPVNRSCCRVYRDSRSSLLASLDGKG